MQTDVDALYDGMIASSIMAHAERRADDSTDYFKSARVRDPLDPTTGTGRNGAVQDGDLRELPRLVVMKGGCGKVTYGCCQRMQTDSGSRSFEAEVASKRSPFAESRVTALASVW